MSTISEFVRPIAAPASLLADSPATALTITTVAESAPSPVVPSLVHGELPTISIAESDKYYGSHPESNWAILDSIMAGAYPAYGNDDKATFSSLIGILNTGITVFVCLQAEYVADAPRMAWYKSTGIRPYMLDIKYIFDNRALYPELTTTSTFADVEFHHLPIVDCKTVADTIVLEFAHKLDEMVRAGKKIYLHCWGGHGRTGTLVCLVFHLQFGIGAEEAITHCNNVHNFRRHTVIVTSPQTAEQNDQVRRIIGDMIHQRQLINPEKETDSK